MNEGGFGNDVHASNAFMNRTVYKWTGKRRGVKRSIPFMHRPYLDV